MFGMQTLDIGIGLVAVYLSLSFVCTAANEFLAGFFNLRAENLRHCINNFLGGYVTGKNKNGNALRLEELFFNHPLIKSLGRKKMFRIVHKPPSYISSKTFSLVLLDILKSKTQLEKGVEDPDIGQIVDGVKENFHLKKIMKVLWDESGQDIEKFKEKLEAWYDNVMSRVAEWYKHKLQLITIIVAAFIVVASNADTIQIIKSLSNDPALRQSLVTQAEALTKDEANLLNQSDFENNNETLNAKKERLEKVHSDLKSLGIPMGWNRDLIPMTENNTDYWLWILSKVMGLFITIFAVSLGAPFWFDLLNKLINLRSSGEREKTGAQIDANKNQK